MPLQIPKPPCVIYDAAPVARQYKQLRSHLDKAYPRSRIFYALKACYVPHVVKELIHLGCGLEITSRFEQQIAVHFGLSGRQIVWNGPGLDETTLRGIVKRGEIVNIDSRQAFEVLSEIAEKQEQDICAGLRLNLTGQGKLGVDPAQAESLIKKMTRLRIIGFHIHPANGFKEPSESQAQRLLFLDLVAGWEKKLGIKPKFLNLGGGFAGRDDLHKLFAPLARKISALRSQPELFLEPGAYLVAEAGTAYANVLAVKTVAGVRWAILDIGANFFVPLQRASFCVATTKPASSPKQLSFGGPLCYEADVIAADQQTSAHVGGIVKVTRCGAYTASMSSNFSSPPPPIYWKDGDHFVRVTDFLKSSEHFLKFHGYLKSIR